jgi:hypothetical protein
MIDKTVLDFDPLEKTKLWLCYFFLFFSFSFRSLYSFLHFVSIYRFMFCNVISDRIITGQCEALDSYCLVNHKKEKIRKQDQTTDETYTAKRDSSIRTELPSEEKQFRPSFSHSNNSVWILFS